jgi:hypothetical protein
VSLFIVLTFFQGSNLKADVISSPQYWNYRIFTLWTMTIAHWILISSFVLSYSMSPLHTVINICYHMMYGTTIMKDKLLQMLVQCKTKRWKNVHYNNNVISAQNYTLENLILSVMSSLMLSLMSS